MGKLSTGQATGTAFWTGGGAAPTPPTPLTVEYEGAAVDTDVTTENFTGAGVGVTDTTAGTVQIDVPGFQGLIRSPDGSCWKVHVDNTGAVTTTKVPCPGTAAPNIVGGTLGGSWGQSFSGAHDVPVGPASVTAGKLLVVVVGASTTLSAHPNISVSDTLGNVWTEITSGWIGADPESSYARVSYFTAIANASGNTTFTLHGTGPSGLLMFVYEITAQNAVQPLGVSGTTNEVTHQTAVGEKFTLFTPTQSGTPAPNSLILATVLDGNWNPFSAGDPSVLTEDASFTLQNNQNPGFGSEPDFGVNVSTNPAGAASSLWTNIDSDHLNSGQLVIIIGLLLEIRAA